MSWSDDLPTFIIEGDGDGEPRPAQVGDEPTHVLISIAELAAHESFYNLTVAQRNKAWHDLDRMNAR